MSALVTLVRHGRTAHNAAGRFQGWADIPLDEAGHAQAQRVAARLARHPVRPTRLYTSDLARTRQTAAHLEAALGLSAQAAPQLREIHVGAWEGLTFAEIAALDADAFAAWPLRAAPGGESLNEVAARLRGFYDGLFPQRGEHVVLVTHGAAITGLVCSLLGWDAAEAWAHKRGLHENTAITTFELSGSGEVECGPLACALHLNTPADVHA